MFLYKRGVTLGLSVLTKLLPHASRRKVQLSLPLEAIKEQSNTSFVEPSQTLLSIYPFTLTAFLLLSSPRQSFMLKPRPPHLSSSQKHLFVTPSKRHRPCSVA